MKQFTSQIYSGLLLVSCCGACEELLAALAMALSVASVFFSALLSVPCIFTVCDPVPAWTMGPPWVTRLWRSGLVKCCSSTCQDQRWQCLEHVKFAERHAACNAAQQLPNATAAPFLSTRKAAARRAERPRRLGGDTGLRCCSTCVCCCTYVPCPLLLFLSLYQPFALVASAHSAAHASSILSLIRCLAHLHDRCCTCVTSARCSLGFKFADKLKFYLRQWVASLLACCALLLAGRGRPR